MRKKFMAMLAAAAMMVSMLAGCGADTSGNETTQKATTKATEESASAADKGTDAKSAETAAPAAASDSGQAKELSVGVVIWSVDDGGLGFSVKKQLEHVGKILNVNFIFKGGSVDAESQIKDVENLIAAGVDGILLCPMVDTTIDKFTAMCDDAGVKLSLMFRSVIDEDVRSVALAAESFVGDICEAEEEAGADLVDALVEAGAKNLALMYCEPGNSVTDRRQAGINARIEELGINVVTTYTMPAGTLSAGFTEGANSILTTYPECDGFLLSFGSDGGIDAVIQLVLSKNLVGKVHVASFDTVQDTKTAFENEILVAETCGSQADALFAFMILYNELQGTPLSDEPIELFSNYVYIKNTEQAAKYDEYWSYDTYQLYSEEEIKNMTKVYNPDLTLDQFKEIVSAYGYEDVLGRLGAE